MVQKVLLHNTKCLLAGTDPFPSSDGENENSAREKKINFLCSSEKFRNSKAENLNSSERIKNEDVGENILYCITYTTSLHPSM